MSTETMTMTNPSAPKKKSKTWLIITIVLLAALSALIFIIVTEPTPWAHELNFYFSRKIAYLEGYFGEWFTIIVERISALFET